MANNKNLENAPIDFYVGNASSYLNADGTLTDAFRDTPGAVFFGDSSIDIGDASVSLNAARTIFLNGMPYARNYDDIIVELAKDAKRVEKVTSESLNDLDLRVSNLQDFEEVTARNMAAISEHFDEIKEANEVTADALNQLALQAKTRDVRLDANDDNIASLKKTIDQVKNDVSGRGADLNASINNVQEYVEDISTRLQNAAGVIDASIESIVGDVSSLNSLISNVSTAQANASEKHIEDVSVLNASIAKAIEDFTAEIARIDKVTSEALNDLDLRVINLQDFEEVTARNMAAISEHLENIKEANAVTASALNQLAIENKNLKIRIDAHDDNVAALYKMIKALTPDPSTNA